MTKTVKCRGCDENLLKNGQQGRTFRVCAGELLGIENGLEKFDESPDGDAVWGYMHERCFLVAVGDPHGIELMATEV